MKMIRSSSKERLPKAATGIVGFDEITGGGLPHGRTTLLVGGPGSGKTIFAMEFLAHGAKVCKEPGIFVAFEESPKRIIANFESFGWNLAPLLNRSLFFLDAQPSPDLTCSGGFDLSGMLAALAAKSKEMGTKRIVFDALDIFLALLPDRASRRAEMYRLHQWLLAHELTALITGKAGGEEATKIGLQPFSFMQFMVDCSVVLNHRVDLGVSQRNLRVQKYRGSNFNEDESPFVIGGAGFDVAIAPTVGRYDARVSLERVSSGVKRMDTMLGGGYYRGASVLITGFPGTAKTTLSGAFSEAACKRGERTMYVTFDSDGSEVIRNLTSVGIELSRYVKNGLLRMVSARGIIGSAETLLVRIRSLAIDTFQSRQRTDRARGGGAVDRLVERRRHHAGVHQPAGRNSEPGKWGDFAVDIDTGRYLDPPQLPGAGGRAQPWDVDHQIARNGSFEPGARVDPAQFGGDAGRHLHRGWGGIDGHAALAKGKRGTSGAGDRGG
jgi:circadian clock protein KaiC